jgi:hypothetical protein
MLSGTDPFETTGDSEVQPSDSALQVLVKLLRKELANSSERAKGLQHQVKLLTANHKHCDSIIRAKDQEIEDNLRHKASCTASVELDDYRKNHNNCAANLRAAKDCLAHGRKEYTTKHSKLAADLQALTEAHNVWVPPDHSQCHEAIRGELDTTCAQLEACGSPEAALQKQLEQHVCPTIIDSATTQELDKLRASVKDLEQTQSEHKKLQHAHAKCDNTDSKQRLETMERQVRDLITNIANTLKSSVHEGDDWSAFADKILQWKSDDLGQLATFIANMFDAYGEFHGAVTDEIPKGIQKLEADRDHWRDTCEKVIVAAEAKVAVFESVVSQLTQDVAMRDQVIVDLKFYSTHEWPVGG